MGTHQSVSPGLIMEKKMTGVPNKREDKVPNAVTFHSYFAKYFNKHISAPLFPFKPKQIKIQQTVTHRNQSTAMMRVMSSVGSPTEVSTITIVTRPA